MQGKYFSLHFSASPFCSASIQIKSMFLSPLLQFHGLLMKENRAITWMLRAILPLNIHADMSDQHLSKSDQESQICLVFQSKRQDVETLRLRLITTSRLHKTAHAVIIGALAVFKVNQSH